VKGWWFEGGKQSPACVERRRGRGRAGELTVPAVGGGWPAGSGLWQEIRRHARDMLYTISPPLL